MGMPRSKSTVSLTERERDDLRELLKGGVLPVRTVIRALVLLRLDEGLSTPQAGSLFELSDEGVRKIALRYREGGLPAAVYEGERSGQTTGAGRNPATEGGGVGLWASAARAGAVDGAGLGRRSQETEDRHRKW